VAAEAKLARVRADAAAAVLVARDEGRQEGRTEEAGRQEGRTEEAGRQEGRTEEAGRQEGRTEEAGRQEGRREEAGRHEEARVRAECTGRPLREMIVDPVMLAVRNPTLSLFGRLGYVGLPLVSVRLKAAVGLFATPLVTVLFLLRRRARTTSTRSARTVRH
jgi:hypothetical protein